MVSQTSTIPLTTPSIAQWEEAGVSLANAFAKYLDLCTSLGTKSLEEGAQSNDLAERIDSKLTSLHSVIEHQAIQARSILSETRNNLASPMHRISEEALVEIFTHVIYSPPNSLVRDGVAEMEDYLLKVYRWIYRLSGICSRWRRVIVAQSHLWTIVPIYRAPKPGCRGSQELYERYRRTTLASLERAQDRCLDIAAVFGPDFTSENFDVLKEYLPRTRTINIVGSKPSDIRCVMDSLIHSPNSLSELSICQKQTKEFYRRMPNDDDCIYSPESPDLAHFDQFILSIPVLRISGARIRHRILPFTDRLTKLRLEAIHFGTDLVVTGYMYYALASATNLRELELVSITSFFVNPEITSPFSDQDTPISFSNLESLLIDDLCCNTLLALLYSTVSSPRRLTIRLTQESRWGNLPEGPPLQTDRFIPLLEERLKRLPVHTLCIHGAFRVTAEELEKLIGSVPALDTLLLDGTVLTTEVCNALKRPDEPHSSDFPSFQYLHFSRATINNMDMEAFKSMVASHSQSMKQLVLGGCIHASSLPDLDIHCSGEDEAKDKEIISQFKEIVPDFRLTGSEYVPPEFRRDPWRLW